MLETLDMDDNPWKTLPCVDCQQSDKDVIGTEAEHDKQQESHLSFGSTQEPGNGFCDTYSFKRIVHILCMLFSVYVLATWNSEQVFEAPGSETDDASPNFPLPDLDLDFNNDGTDFDEPSCDFDDERRKNAEQNSLSDVCHPDDEPRQCHVTETPEHSPTFQCPVPSYAHVPDFASFLVYSTLPSIFLFRFHTDGFRTVRSFSVQVVQPFWLLCALLVWTTNSLLTCYFLFTSSCLGQHTARKHSRRNRYKPPRDKTKRSSHGGIAKAVSFSTTFVVVVFLMMLGRSRANIITQPYPLPALVTGKAKEASDDSYPSEHCLLSDRPEDDQPLSFENLPEIPDRVAQQSDCQDQSGRIGSCVGTHKLGLTRVLWDWISKDIVFLVGLILLLLSSFMYIYIATRFARRPVISTNSEVGDLRKTESGDKSEPIVAGDSEDDIDPVQTDNPSDSLDVPVHSEAKRDPKPSLVDRDRVQIASDNGQKATAKPATLGTPPQSTSDKEVPIENDPPPVEICDTHENDDAQPLGEHLKLKTHEGTEPPISDSTLPESHQVAKPTVSDEAIRTDENPSEVESEMPAECHPVSDSEHSSIDYASDMVMSPPPTMSSGGDTSKVVVSPERHLPSMEADDTSRGMISEDSLGGLLEAETDSAVGNDQSASTVGIQSQSEQQDSIDSGYNSKSISSLPQTNKEHIRQQRSHGNVPPEANRLLLPVQSRHREERFTYADIVAGKRLNLLSIPESETQNPLYSQVPTPEELLGVPDPVAVQLHGGCVAIRTSESEADQSSETVTSEVEDVLNEEIFYDNHQLLSTPLSESVHSKAASLDNNVDEEKAAYSNGSPPLFTLSNDGKQSFLLTSASPDSASTAQAVKFDPVSSSSAHVPPSFSPSAGASTKNFDPGGSVKNGSLPSRQRSHKSGSTDGVRVSNVDVIPSPPKVPSTLLKDTQGDGQGSKVAKEHVEEPDLESTPDTPPKETFGEIACKESHERLSSTPSLGKSRAELAVISTRKDHRLHFADISGGDGGGVVRVQQDGDVLPPRIDGESKEDTFETPCEEKSDRISSSPSHSETRNELAVVATGLGLAGLCRSQSNFVSPPVPPSPDVDPLLSTIRIRCNNPDYVMINTLVEQNMIHIPPHTTTPMLAPVRVHVAVPVSVVYPIFHLGPNGVPMFGALVERENVI